MLMNEKTCVIPIFLNNLIRMRFYSQDRNSSLTNGILHTQAILCGLSLVAMEFIYMVVINRIYEVFEMLTGAKMA